MPGQKNDQAETVQNEAGGVSGRTGLDKGNPWPRHASTVSPVHEYGKCPVCAVSSEQGKHLCHEMHTRHCCPQPYRIPIRSRQWETRYY